MKGRKDLFNHMDESRVGDVKFSDGSSIDIYGEGPILVKCSNGEELEFKNVL